MLTYALQKWNFGVFWANLHLKNIVKISRYIASNEISLKYRVYRKNQYRSGVIMIAKTLIIGCRQRGGDCKLRLRRKGEWRERAGFFFDWKLFCRFTSLFWAIGVQAWDLWGSSEMNPCCRGLKDPEGAKRRMESKEKAARWNLLLSPQFTWQAIGKLRPLCLHFT